MISMNQSKKNSKRGQAMIEFVIGIIVVIVVFGSFIQIGLLTNERMDAYAEATHEAASISAWQSADPTQAAEPYVLATSIGNDEQWYSADDRQVGGSGDEVINGIVRHGLTSQLTTHLDDNPFTDIRGGNDLNAEFGMIRGEENRIGIPLLPVVRRLVYGDDRIDINEEVITIETRGIY